VTAIEGDATEPTTGGPASDAETLLGFPVTRSCSQRVLHVPAEEWVATMWRLRDDEHFEMLTDLCGVDYLTHPGRSTLPPDVDPQRFEVVVELLSLSKTERLRVRTQLPAAAPTLPSLYEVWAAADALEREAADLYGITFEGHPDPNRILMPEDWEGHPLRKDYAVGRIPVQFKAPQAGRPRGR